MSKIWLVDLSKMRLLLGEKKTEKESNKETKK